MWIISAASTCRYFHCSDTRQRDDVAQHHDKTVFFEAFMKKKNHA